MIATNRRLRLVDASLLIKDQYSFGTIMLQRSGKVSTILALPYCRTHLTIALSITYLSNPKEGYAGQSEQAWSQLAFSLSTLYSRSRSTELCGKPCRLSKPARDFSVTLKSDIRSPDWSRCGGRVSSVEIISRETNTLETWALSNNLFWIFRSPLMWIANTDVRHGGYAASRKVSLAKHGQFNRGDSVLEQIHALCYEHAHNRHSPRTGNRAPAKVQVYRRYNR